MGQRSSFDCSAVAELVRRGIIVVHFPSKRLRTEPQVAVAAEIASALAAGRRRGPVDIRALAAR